MLERLTARLHRQPKERHAKVESLDHFVLYFKDVLEMRIGGQNPFSDEITTFVDNALEGSNDRIPLFDKKPGNPIFFKAGEKEQVVLALLWSEELVKLYTITKDPNAKGIHVDQEFLNLQELDKKLYDLHAELFHSPSEGENR